MPDITNSPRKTFPTANIRPGPSGFGGSRYVLPRFIHVAQTLSNQKGPRSNQAQQKQTTSEAERLNVVERANETYTNQVEQILTTTRLAKQKPTAKQKTISAAKSQPGSGWQILGTTTVISQPFICVCDASTTCSKQLQPIHLSMVQELQCH